MIRIENSCSGKHPYDTFENANSSAANINKGNSGRRVVSYRCTTCSKIHLGHQSKGKKMKSNSIKTKHKAINHIHKPGIHRLDDEI